jgi:hypothetical protein
VQNIDSIRDLDRIHSPICIAHVIFHNIQYTRPAKPFQRLGLVMLLASLGQMKCKTKDIDDIAGHCKQIFLGRSDPLQGFDLIGHLQIISK